MVMSVVKGDLGRKESKGLIGMLKEMKEYMVDNEALLGEREYVEVWLERREKREEVVDLGMKE